MIHRRQPPRAQWVRKIKDPFNRRIVETTRMEWFTGEPIDQYRLECGHIAYRSVRAADRDYSLMRCSHCIADARAKARPARQHRTSDAEAIVGYYTANTHGRRGVMDSARMALAAEAA